MKQKIELTPEQKVAGEAYDKATCASLDKMYLVFDGLVETHLKDMQEGLQKYIDLLPETDRREALLLQNIFQLSRLYTLAMKSLSTRLRSLMDKICEGDKTEDMTFFLKALLTVEHFEPKFVQAITDAEVLDMARQLLAADSLKNVIGALMQKAENQNAKEAEKPAAAN